MGCGSSTPPPKAAPKPDVNDDPDTDPALLLTRPNPQTRLSVFSLGSTSDLRRYSLLPLPAGENDGAPVRRLSLSIHNAGKDGGDTISIRTTNIHVKPEENATKPTQNGENKTARTENEPKPTVPIETETKPAENGSVSTEEGTKEQTQTTVENTANDSGVQKNQLLNLANLQAKIQNVGIRALVEEVTEARKADPSNRDLDALGLTLQLSQNALKYDPKQLPSQLLSRITAPTDGLSALLEQCRDSEDLYLLCNHQVLLSPGGQLAHVVSDHTTNATCMTLTSDGKHAITCSEDGIMMITDVTKGRRERKIPQIGKSPDAVYLCCDEKLVVTASDERLVAHTLETGEEVWTLADLEYSPYMAVVGPRQDQLVIFQEKEVMFYEAKSGTKLQTLDLPEEPDIVFEPYGPKPCSNDRYVVATDTDYLHLVLVDYLDRRIIAVKPTPYPEDQDEDLDYSIESLAITGCNDNETYIIYTTAQAGDLVFLDTPNLEVVKVYKDDTDILRLNYHLSPDERYLYFPNRPAGICVWDLHNAQMCTILPEAKEIKDVRTVDMKIFVTIADDRNVRIWDVSQGLQEGQTSAFDFKDQTVINLGTGEQPREIKREKKNEVSRSKDRSDKKKKSDVEIWDCTMLESPRYILLEVKVKDICHVQVYDVAMNTVVRSMQLGKDVAVTHLKGPQVLVRKETRFRLVDVDKMEVVTEFQGEVHRYEAFKFKPVPLNGGKEVLTTTKEAHHLKIYDTQTGKVTAIIKQVANKNDRLWTLEDFLISKDGSVGIAEAEDRFVVFDLVNRKMKSIVDNPDIVRGFTLGSRRSALTDDGQYFVYVGILPRNPNADLSKPRQECICVYDLHTDSLVGHLTDMQAALKYQAQDEDKTVDVYNVHVLDNSTIIASHGDSIIRVYDMHTGEILHRLEGHRREPTLHIREDTAVFLSHVNFIEENSVRVWSKSDFTPLASFTSDTLLLDVVLIPGHCEDFLALPTECVSDTPFIFSLHGKKKEALLGKQSPLASYPELYKGTKLDGVLPATDVLQKDPDDPDKGFLDGSEEEYDEDWDDDDDDEDADDEEDKSAKIK